MKYTIELPYAPGDTVWLSKFDQRHFEQKCSTCKGTGRLSNCDGESVKCGNCHGNGSSGYTRQDWRSEEKVIDSVEVEIFELGDVEISLVRFRTNGETDEDGWKIEDTEFSGRNIFKTKEECDEHCKDLNFQEQNKCF